MPQQSSGSQLAQLPARNAKRGTYASQDVSVQNGPFACGSSSAAVRQALDKALDKTHQEQHKQSLLNWRRFHKKRTRDSTRAAIRWVKNDDEAAFDRGAASESRGTVAPPLVVQ